MKLNNTLEEYRINQLEAEIEGFINSKFMSEAIKMRFLEESAMYLGVYMDNNPTGFLEKKDIN